MTTSAEHIDRKSLYTSLEARIEYLHKFLDFNDGEPFLKTPIAGIIMDVF